MIYTFHGSPGVPPKASVFRFRHLSSQPRSVCLLALPCLASRVLGEWPMRLISFGSVCLVAFPVLQRARLPRPLVASIIAVVTSGEQGLLCKIRRVAGKQMKLIQRSTKCGKDVAKAGWPIASEEYLISCSPVVAQERQQHQKLSLLSLLAHKLSYLIFMATQMRKLCPTAFPHCTLFIQWLSSAS